MIFSGGKEVKANFVLVGLRREYGHFQLRALLGILVAVDLPFWSLRLLLWLRRVVPVEAEPGSQ